MADKDTEPTKEQEKTAESTMRGADGTYNPAKVNLSKMFADKANERSYTDEQGNKKSYNKGTKWQAYIDKNVTDPAAKADMEKQIYDLVSANPNMSDKELKFRLRAIQSNLIRRYPNGVSKKFDISGGMFDRTMAKDLLKLGLKGEQQPAKTETKPTETSPAAKQEPAKTEQKPAGKQVGNTNKDVANAQVGDYIIRKDGSTYVLKQADIDWAKKKFAPAETQTPAQPTTATQTKTPAPAANTTDDDAFMKQYTTYAGQRTPEARKFMSDPANVKRYQEILKKRNSAKNNGKVEKLKQELELHKKIMAENPGRKDIQDAQQSWIDSITKKIEKLGGSVE